MIHDNSQPRGFRMRVGGRPSVLQFPFAFRARVGTVWLATLSLILGSTGTLSAAQQPGNLEAVQLEDRIRVTLNESVVTEYRFASSQKYPYFYPVNGPASGQSVTTESSEPYPHHHSLFFGSDFVNGGNYWQDGLERGQIIAQETEIVRASGTEVEFVQTNIWARPGAEPPIRDERTVRISAPSAELRYIDFDITLIPLIDVRIEQTNHSLFAARMVPELSVENGGTLLNSRGGRNAEGTFSELAEWADYWGTRDGIAEGLAIFNHPENAWTPPPWFTRDYGFFSPTPFNWMENGFLALPVGERLRLRYRVVVHSGSTEDAGIGELFLRYLDSL